LHERLKRWRKKVSDSLGIESTYVLNRQILGLGRPNTQAKLESIEGSRIGKSSGFSGGLIETVTRSLEDEKSGTLPIKRKNRPR
jgi:hypothetical protein